jgi:peptide deformylase
MQSPNDVNLIFKLAYYPDNHLRRRTEVVTDFTSIEWLAEKMFETMLIHSGIGLAANQCKLPQRMFVMRTEKIRRVFVNPELIIREGDKLVEHDETCLSFPGIVVKVPRYTQLMVKAQDARGYSSYTPLDGIEAICAQHEMDHLDGKTFVDHMGRIKRLIAERTVKKYLKDPTCLKQRKRL